VTSRGPPTEPEVREVRRLADGVEIELTVPEDLLCFRGHFPGRPILPGIAQIDWAVRLADRHLGTAIDAARTMRVKFRAIIVPNQALTVVLRRPAGAAQLTFEYRSGGAVMSSGTIGIEDAG
jgi:3-hydroxymyristoyl/3-hydroxydecanoyl-(acyl carrier protein) dehydratase